MMFFQIRVTFICIMVQMAATAFEGQSVGIGNPLNSSGTYFRRVSVSVSKLPTPSPLTEEVAVIIPTETRATAETETANYIYTVNV